MPQCFPLPAMSATTLHHPPGGSPLAELRTWLRAAAAKFRLRREFSAVVHLDVASDIASDAIALNTAAAHSAHRAETCDREALRLLAAARQPRSPGGRLITAREAAAIARLVKTSAELDHSISEVLHVPAEKTG